MAQAGRGNVAVEQGEVRRMEHRVAQPRQAGGQEQAGIAVGQGQSHTGGRQAGDAEEQHPPRSQPVHGEAGQGLADAGDDEEEGHGGPHLGEAEAELLHQPGKKRRQQEVEEMGDAVGEAHHADGGVFAPALQPGGLACFSAGRDGGEGGSGRHALGGCHSGVAIGTHGPGS